MRNRILLDKEQDNNFRKVQPGNKLMMIWGEEGAVMHMQCDHARGLHCPRLREGKSMKYQTSDRTQPRKQVENQPCNQYTHTQPHQLIHELPQPA